MSFDEQLPALKDGKKCSVLLRSLKFFLSKMAMLGITAASECFASETVASKPDVFTPKEIDDYNRCDAISNSFPLIVEVSNNREFKKTTTATSCRTPPNNSVDKQNNETSRQNTIWLVSPLSSAKQQREMSIFQVL